MPDTINQVRDEFYKRYADGQSASDSVFLALANDADADINKELKFRTNEYLLSSIVSGTHEYAINDLILSIIEAWYYTSSSSYVKLQVREVSDLAQTGMNWRVAQSGEPYTCYVRPTETTRVIGLIGAPTSSTSGGYPVLKLYTTIRKEFAVGDNLHGAFKARQLYTAKVCHLHALTHHQSDAGGWAQLYAGLLEEARSTLYGIHPFKHPSILPHGGMRFHRD